MKLKIGETIRIGSSESIAPRWHGKLAIVLEIFKDGSMTVKCEGDRLLIFMNECRTTIG